jgi:hypothetical protein
MIGPDDIAAFEEAQADNLDAAAEYNRRMMKGLPTDRFTDGAAGAVKVARGIAALGTIALAWQALALQRGGEEMEPHRDPMRSE